MTKREQKLLKQVIENSINVKEQLPELAEMLKDYPLFDDYDFFVNVDSTGFKLYLRDMVSLDYEAYFIFDCPTWWFFDSIGDCGITRREAKLLYIFEEHCREICEIVKKYMDKKAA